MLRITKNSRLVLLVFGVIVPLVIPVSSEAATPREVKRIVASVAADTAVPPSMALAVASIESGFRDDFESAAGARGVMQVTPEMAERHNVAPRQLWDARRNVELGLEILAGFFRTSSHEWHAALQEYAKSMPGGYGPRRFARKVLRLERRFAEEIVTRKALEQRKREVLNVAQDDGAVFVEEADRDIVWQSVSAVEDGKTPQPTSRATPFSHGTVDVDLTRRLALARRNLDDFSGGRVPEHLMKPRSERRQYP